MSSQLPQQEEENAVSRAFAPDASHWTMLKPVPNIDDSYLQTTMAGPDERRQNSEGERIAWENTVHTKIDEAFRDKMLIPVSKRRAVLVVGPESSGKHTNGQQYAMENFATPASWKSFVTVSLDNTLNDIPGYAAADQQLKKEGEKFFEMPGFVENKLAAGIYEQRINMRERATVIARQISEGVLGRVVKDGYNSFITMNPTDQLAVTHPATHAKETLDAPGMANLMKSLDVRVDVVHYLMPASVAMERMVGGNRIQQPKEVLASRLKSYEDLPKMLSSADSVQVVLGEGDTPRTALIWKRQELSREELAKGTKKEMKLVTVDENAQTAFLRILEKDKLYFIQHHEDSPPNALERLNKVERTIMETFPSRVTPTESFLKRLSEQSGNRTR